MYVCMYVCMHVCVHVYVCMYVCRYACMYVCVCMYLCKCVCVYVYMLCYESSHRRMYGISGPTCIWYYRTVYGKNLICQYGTLQYAEYVCLKA